jgi:hypothetical protein
LVCLADSEADIYELLVEAQAEPREVEWIVRACQNRALQGGEEKDAENGELADTAANNLAQQVLRREVFFTQTIKVRGRKAKVSCEDRGRRGPRESRTAEVEVRAAPVRLRAPWRPDRKLPEVSVNVVLVREINPPANEPPVEWMLLTSLPIDDAEQVRGVIQYYCVRWMVEVFHVQCGEKDNLYRGDRWPYSQRTGVAEVGTLVPATQAFRFRRKPMRDVKEDAVPPRAQQDAISVSL